MDKILCPVDFSAASLNAIEFAARIGAQHRATLTLFHVFTADEFDQVLADGDLVSRFPSENMGARYAEEMLKSLADEVIQMSGPEGLAGCDYYFSDGPLEQQLVTYADQQGYPLVVMGTAGVKDIYEQYGGSHTTRTMDRSHCPVLCIPERVEYQPLKKVMYATDYQEEDAAILQQVMAIVAPFGAQLEVVHIVPDQDQRDEAVYQDYVAQTRRTLPDQAVHFSQKVYEDVLHGIDHYAIEQEANLVVLVRKHHNFLERMLEQDTTQRLSYFATYPVMVFQEIVPLKEA